MENDDLLGEIREIAAKLVAAAAGSGSRRHHAFLHFTSRRNSARSAVVPRPLFKTAPFLSAARPLRLLPPKSKCENQSRRIEEKVAADDGPGNPCQRSQRSGKLRRL